MSIKGKILTALAVFVVAAGAVATVVAVDLFYVKNTDEVKTHTVGDGKSVRVGIVSDSQLPGDGKDSRWTQVLKQSLMNLKEKGIDVLVYAGDFTDVGTKDAWESYEKVYNEVFPEGEEPILSYIMGNHDYWLGSFFDDFEIPTPAKMQKRFMKYTGEKPFNHKVVNGYHFIGWGSGNGSYDNCNKNETWVRAQIEEAIAADPNKPVFVTTHLNPTDTVYGSDDWGNDDIRRVLNDYPQVVSLSGHSHYSLLDERSMWQGDFTAMSTQSLDYIELEEGKFNGSVPKDAYGNNLATVQPVSMYMTVSESGTTWERLSAKTGEKIKHDWTLASPVTKDTFNHKLETLLAKNTAPLFDGTVTGQTKQEKDVDGKEIKTFTFSSAKDDDFVHSYKLVFKDANGATVLFNETDYSGAEIRYNDKDEAIGKDSANYSKGKTKEIGELLYFSDFVIGLEKMAPNFTLRLPASLPASAVQVEITAIDSYGVTSASVMVKL